MPTGIQQKQCLRYLEEKNKNEDVSREESIVWNLK